MKELARASKRPYGTGRLYQPKGSRFYWIKFHVNGVPVRESTQTANKRKAQRFLNTRLAQVSNGSFLSLKAERTTVQELADDFLRDYRVNNRKSFHDVQERWMLHLEPFFGHLRASRVSSDLIVKYVDSRQQQGAANATINRELAALKRMFRLGAQATPPKVFRVPHFQMLQERNVRTGFLDDRQFTRLAEECAKVGLWLRSMLEVGYTYGWRVSELLTLRVRQVDLALRVIRLDPGTTKNDDGREVTMTDSVFQLLKECVFGKQPDDCVFTRKNGRPVREFRALWQRVCCKAEVGRLICADCNEPVDAQRRCPRCLRTWKVHDLKYSGLIFHDLRRSAARNLRRAGVAEGVIQKIGGWKTRSVFERYAIVDQRDIADAMHKLETAKIRHSLGIGDQEAAHTSQDAQIVHPN